MHFPLYRLDFHNIAPTKIMSHTYSVTIILLSFVSDEKKKDYEWLWPF